MVHIKKKNLKKSQMEPAGTKMVMNLTYNRPWVSLYFDLTTCS